MTINVVQTQKLPAGVDAACIPNEDDTWTILVSQDLPPVKKQAAVVHELAHITRADFCTDTSAGVAEREVREAPPAIQWDDLTIHYDVDCS